MFWAVPVVADSSALTISADQQIGLGDHFFSSGEYDRAATAYETFLYFFPDSERAEYARFQIARAFFEKGEVEAALERFEKLYAEGKDTGFRAEAGFMAGRCHVALGRRSLALSMMTRLAENYDDPAIHERVFYETAWSYLETAPVLAEEDLAAAMESFQRISPPGQERLHVRQMLRALEQARYDDDGLLASMKRPGLAGALAVVPGAGYLYCGRYQDALISFLFNGAMILAAWEAFDKDQEALGAVLSMVELGFYGGNVYGSVSAAHKYNRQRTGVFMKGLRSIGAGFVPAGDGVGVKVSFQQPF
ncbi:MAG: tetratricopeptide repeat protein [Thermodesulfobacteriota bacterium]